MHRTRTLAMLALTGMTMAAACGGDEGAADPGGVGGGAGSGPLGVGSACEADTDCGGFDHAVCLDEIRPLVDLVEDTGEAANTALRDLALPFPGGYCGTLLETPCDSDAQCGDAACFRPFEGVSDEAIQNLNGLGLPFDVAAFAQTGTCLVPCTGDSDCRQDEGYVCIVPLTDLIAVVNQDYAKTFCVQDVDTSFLLQ